MPGKNLRWPPGAKLRFRLPCCPPLPETRVNATYPESAQGGETCSKVCSCLQPKRSGIWFPVSGIRDGDAVEEGTRLASRSRGMAGSGTGWNFRSARSIEFVSTAAIQAAALAVQMPGDDRPDREPAERCGALTEHRFRKISGPRDLWAPATLPGRKTETEIPREKVA